MRLLLALCLVALAAAQSPTTFRTTTTYELTTFRTTYLASPEGYTSQYELLVYPSPSTADEAAPAVVLGSLQGTYTSDTAYGQALYICVDGGRLQGSYDEVGVFNGEVDDDGVAAGNWYEAGTGACTSGTFRIAPTAFGFSGTFTCGDGGEEFAWEEDRISNFRPSDERCALLDLDDDEDAAGRWLDGHNNPTDFCVFGGAGEASYLREQDGDSSPTPKREGYVEAQAHERGKVLTGTWYEELVGGAALYYRRDNGELHAQFWTGLRGVLGDTVIDPSQLRDEERHWHVSLTGPFFPASTGDCGRFAPVKQYVLVNAPKTDDDDGIYYFVGSDYFTSDFPFYEYPESSNSAAALPFAAAALAAAALALF
eukprot:TRINITY_DN4360_c0_g1_i1.p2 TRINITY_DN4360_c0_g1~~TRINITY_DN4360_c0_g1_i1.p2  ORF type:complete len:387 (-),score=114.38 TRINITY_DN4360_c0_g1_i1:43-1149(-)